MTHEEKQLLLIDLCSRLLYRTFVCLNPGAYNKPETCILTGVHGEKVHLNVDSDPFRIDHIKPYLRPLSSMNEREKGFFMWLTSHRTVDDGFGGNVEMYSLKCIDWLNANGFDYRGLIPMGLALEAKEGMYKTE